MGKEIHRRSFILGQAQIFPSPSWEAAASERAGGWGTQTGQQARPASLAGLPTVRGTVIKESQQVIFHPCLSEHPGASPCALSALDKTLDSDSMRDTTKGFPFCPVSLAQLAYP